MLDCATSIFEASGKRGDATDENGLAIYFECEKKSGDNEPGLGQV